MDEKMIYKLKESCDLIGRASAQYNAYLEYLQSHADQDLDNIVEKDLEWICAKIEHFCYDMIHCVRTVDKDYQDSIKNKK